MTMRIMGLLIAFALSFSTVAEAARVTPMTIELEPTGRLATGRIEVTNSEDRELPMEVRMFRGTIGERGELDLEPADDQFLVFPPQRIIGANEQQVFRVQYLPGEPLSQSEIFYASIMQIPVDITPTVSRIQVVMRFNVLVNVVPPGTSSEPSVSWARPMVIEPPEPDQEGLLDTAVERTGEVPQPLVGVEVRIENSGSRFFAAGRTDWTITGTTTDGEEFSLSRTASEMGSEIGIGVVPPGGARIFFVATDQPLQEESISISLD